jgi:hypothetical protein
MANGRSLRMNEHMKNVMMIEEIKNLETVQKYEVRVTRRGLICKLI